MQIEAGSYYVTRDGRKVGPIGTHEDDTHPYTCTVDFDEPYEVSRAIWTEDGTNYQYRWLDLVSLWQKPTSQGPVRTKTVKELLPGVYGRIDVSPYASTAVTHVGVRFEPMSDSYAALNATELRAAAATLLEIAEALE